MLQDPVFANNLKCRWSYLRTNILSDEHLMNYIDSLGTILEEPAQRNYDRWPILGVYVWPNNFIGNTYQEELTYMKNWILARTAWMDANMFGTCYSLGIFEETKQTLKLFPNPSSDIFYLEGLTNAAKIEIRNEMGQCIETFTANSEIIFFDASHFSNGLYFVIVKDSTQDPIKLIILH
jgi:hypothetical protein